MKITTTENLTLDLTNFTADFGNEPTRIESREFNGNIELTITQGVEAIKLIIDPKIAKEVSEKLMQEAQYY